MVGRSRFSIAGAMVVILVLAADCAVLRAFMKPLLSLPYMILPMINVLLLGLTRRDPDARRFWVGFEVAGWSMILLILGLRSWDPGGNGLPVLYLPVVWLFGHQWISGGGPAELIVAVGCISVFYTIPQVLVASAAGWLWARLRAPARPGRPGPGAAS